LVRIKSTQKYDARAPVFSRLLTRIEYKQNPLPGATVECV